MRDFSSISAALLLSVTAVTPGCVAPEEIDLESHEESLYSQNGEDGVLRKIFELIEPGERFAVEFGASDGFIGSNVRNLVLNAGWNALMIEGDPERAEKCAANYEGYPGTRCIQEWVFPGNVELLFEDHGVPRDLDLLVIDIDSNDWYVWRAIHDFRPKVVLIEYNAIFTPPTRMVIEFHPLNYWDDTAYFGASIQSMYELGKKKGYELLYADRNGINLFFVDAIYYDRFGIRDNSPEKLYRPYRGVYQLPPDQLPAWIDANGRPLPPNHRDLVWDEVRIKKRFLIDQR